MLLRPEAIKLEQIYVPARLHDTLDKAKVEQIAESIMEVGQTTPIRVRKDTSRYVLVSGYHRLEAMKLLGEATIQALIVASPRA